MRVARLGYVRVGLNTPQSWLDIVCGLLGMETVDRDDKDDAKFVKMDDHPFRYMIEVSEEERLLACGWEFESKAEWRSALQVLEQAGVAYEKGSSAEAARRCVTEFAQLSDPAGNTLEIYYGRTEMGDPYTPQMDVKGFCTDEMGLGHVVLPAPNQDETHKFYTDLFGFRDVDDLTLPPPQADAGNIRIRFLCANNPRHHSLALYNFPVPSGCVHLMAEVGSLDEVGCALDRVTKAGVPLLAGLGRHENDLMVSFYVIGPAGIAIEFGYDGKTIDPDTYRATQSTDGDIWGHEYQLSQLS